MQIIFTDQINRKLFFQRNYSVAWNLPIEERIDFGIRYLQVR